QNRTALSLVAALPRQPTLDAEPRKNAIEDGSIVFVATRDHHEVHRGTVPGSINVPLFNKPATHAGWAYDPESDDLPLVVLADNRELAQMLWDHLIRVGIDDVSGFVTGLDGLPTVVPELVSPEDLTSTNFDLLLDVRNASEYAEGTIPGAQQLSAGRVLWNQDQLPDDG